MEKYIPIGFTKKCHGVKGELKVHVEEKYEEDFIKSTVIFLLIKGKHVPHFVEKIRTGNDTILKLEEVNSKETALQISSKEIFLQPHQILKEEERVFELSEELEFEKYLGFNIIDSELGDIGTIEEVVEFPQQEMAVVLREGNEIFIPLHDNLIEKTDEKKQYIYMNLPDGLLDL